MTKNIDRRTCLYRQFDATGALLYVGVSVNPQVRTSAHSASSAWFCDVAQITVEWFDTRAEAEAAEISAIKTENPRHNVKEGEQFRIGKNCSEFIEVSMPYKQDKTERHLIIRKAIDLEPVYPLYRVARLLGLSLANLKGKIESRQIRTVNLGPPRRVASKRSERMFPDAAIGITGKAIIEFLDSLDQPCRKQMEV